ncbi:MAG: MiaB/RimO family radical SAM methylthiotransferase [Synergistaceae bacterium]|nr:MiaB/RimO family radical SAM methylthiotransferase [Synergistaceae bacterium]
MQGDKGMGLVCVHVFGCRSSLCEGEYIAGRLKELGHDITEDLKDGITAAIIVTCSVTSEADRKCRQMVRRARKILGDDGVLAVSGCWGQSLDSGMAQSLGIDILGGTRGVSALIPSAVSEMLGHGREFRDIRRLDVHGWQELPLTQPVMHTRAFMKIQDGCNHFCTYCIIPYLRGKPASRPENSIISEIHRLIDGGTKEVIFTGIHLGVYGHDNGTSLARLIRRVSGISGLERLRLGSLEPFCLNDELLDALAECAAFCHHLHLPLQSGDDEILSAMRRGYSAHDFVNVCRNARRKIDASLHISSDILVGFPGESDSAFQNTLDVMELAGLGRVHVFPYSERPGTIAASLPGKIPHDVKISRTSEAISLGRKLYADYVRGFTGHEVEILIERDGRGYTRHYIEAHCEGGNNETVKAEVIDIAGTRLECMRRN